MQLWSVPAEGGYLWSENLSNHLRMKAQPLTKFRQFATLPDDADLIGKHRGDTFKWNVYSALRSRGRRLSETAPIPESSFDMTQKSMTLFEAGNSVPFSGLLTALAKHTVEGIIDRTLKDDCRKFHDTEAYLQFKRTPLRASPTSGTSTTSVDFTTNSAANTTNNVELGTGHVKAIVDYMKERNIPAFMGDDYVCISHPTTFRSFKNSLESIKQYTETGLTHIFRGELGKYEDTRFVEQNHIPKGGANDSTTYDAWGTADAWNNNKSSWAFFCGGDLLMEAPVVPEEVRARLPGDYGRSKGIAWYYLGAYGLSLDDAENARIVMWDSAA